MSKNYNLSSSSDMRRFKADLEKQVLDKARGAVTKKTYQVICPACKTVIQTTPGKHICPRCGKEIDLKLNIKF